MARKAPPVTEDDKETAKSVLQLLEFDRETGIRALEVLCAAARHWGKRLS